jgi:hypothetical protein
MQAFKDDEFFAECGLCHLQFCPKCMGKSHGETPCRSLGDKMDELRQKLDAGKITYDEWQAEKRKVEDEVKSLALLEKSTKVRKNEGRKE